MNSVLLSIQPQWCGLIASGKKTIEVRKTKPKLDTPFKCYIYCTNKKTVGDLVLINSDHIVFVLDYLDYRFIALDIVVGILHKLYSFDVKETLGEIENMMNRKVY